MALLISHDAVLGSVSISDASFFLVLHAAFYSSKYGYKMCLRLYLNGDGTGRGTHLSLFFVVMRGKCDALLKWPFSQKVGNRFNTLTHETLDERHETNSSFSSPPGDSDALGSEQQGAHHRCFPTGRQLLVLPAADQ